LELFSLIPPIQGRALRRLGGHSGKMDEIEDDEEGNEDINHKSD
jgi:hypothetical protein